MEREKGKTKPRGKGKSWILPALAICLVLAAVLGGSLYKKYYDHKVPNFTSTTELYVRPGDDMSSLRQYILDSCSALNRKSLERALSEENVGDIPAGHYTIDRGCTSIYVARMLSRGWQSPVKLVLSGTMRTKGSIARKIANQMMVDSVDVAASLQDAQILSSYGFTPSTVFSLFIPDTYEMYWTASVEDILDRQKKAWDSFWTEENKKKAAQISLTPGQVSVLASIVEAETNKPEEMPRIAGVYLNRLRKGMRLQADPTIAYILDYSVNRILRRHLEIESPYNTYLHEGLPPGPICVPTKAALQAVLGPEKGDYLYFCASASFDGTHVFAKTLSEHNRNAAAYQKALSEYQRKKRGASK